MTADELKVILDIGLGALSLLLWFRQTRINAEQTKSTIETTKQTAALTGLVADHDRRITNVERNIFSSGVRHSEHGSFSDSGDRLRPRHSGGGVVARDYEDGGVTTGKWRAERTPVTEGGRRCPAGVTGCDCTRHSS